PQTLEVVANGSTVDVARDRFSSIRVYARGGDDNVRADESNGAFTTTTPTQLNGQRGNDTLVGGSGADTLNGGSGDDNLVGGSGNELLVGGDGNDAIDGNQGADVAFMGAGDDRFTWDPGEVKTDLAGSVSADDGAADQVIVNGTNAADAITAAGSAGNVSVTGLAARVDITHAQVAQDVLAITALAGDDVVDGSGLAADA